MKLKTVTDDIVDREIGAEWDTVLLIRLRDVVTGWGGTMTETLRGVAGSQDIAEFEILLEGLVVVVTAETYMGLRLRGPESLVDRLVKELSLQPRDDS